MRKTSFATLILLALVQAGPSPGGDFWIGPSEPGVGTNNDCGVISDVDGSPVIRRAFMEADDRGLAADAADRLNSGDEARTPSGARLELISGDNVIIVLGPNARVKFAGLRTFVANGVPTTRLDIQLLAGAVRIQTRLNEKRPESVLATLDGAEILLTRGDVEISAEGGGWRASVLAGSAQVRLRRGGVTGAPFVLREGMGVGSEGESPLGADFADAVRRRLPFSFEALSASLPPRPALGSLMEAP